MQVFEACPTIASKAPVASSAARRHRRGHVSTASCRRAGSCPAPCPRHPRRTLSWHQQPSTHSVALRRTVKSLSMTMSQPHHALS
eukprot:7346235-Lingulodinium_polyedra.AAC.1